MSVQQAVPKEELIKKLKAQVQATNKFPKLQISEAAIEHEIKSQSQYPSQCQYNVPSEES